MRADAQPEGSGAPAGDHAASELLHELLRRTHLSAPSDVARVVAEQAHSIGAYDVAIYVVDYEQTTLLPLPGSQGTHLDRLSIAGTLAGRAFSSTTILRTPAEEHGHQRLWLPLLDGTERMGVMSMSLPDDALSGALLATCERYSHLVAMLIVTKGAYGDVFEVTRRRQPMTLASELLWSLVPPSTFATEQLAIAGMLEPCYDNGGDAYDYAIDEGLLHLAVFDAMGHGLAAAGVAAFALAAYRQSRRSGRDLLGTYSAMDEAVGRQFPDNRFVTALIAQLDVETGRLAWISAGHPPPLLLRGGRRPRTLETTAVPPLGVDLAHAPAVVAHESLEPGDLLLAYTDGLTEARDADGNLFGLDGLSEFIGREAGAGRTTPETLRRLRHAVIGSGRAKLRDDASALLLEWRRGGEEALMPQTVL